DPFFRRGRAPGSITRLIKNKKNEPINKMYPVMRLAFIVSDVCLIKIKLRACVKTANAMNTSPPLTESRPPAPFNTTMETRDRPINKPDNRETDNFSFDVTAAKIDVVKGAVPRINPEFGAVVFVSPTDRQECCPRTPVIIAKKSKPV